MEKKGPLPKGGGPLRLMEQIQALEESTFRNDQGEGETDPCGKRGKRSRVYLPLVGQELRIDRCHKQRLKILKTDLTEGSGRGYTEQELRERRRAAC